MASTEADKAYWRKYYQKNRKRLLEYYKSRKKSARAALGLRCKVCGKPIPEEWRSNVTCSHECAQVRKRELNRENTRAYYARIREARKEAPVEDWQQAVIDVMNLPATERWQYARHWGQKERNFAKRIEENRISCDRRINREVYWRN